jgi:hypothetical protein
MKIKLLISLFFPMYAFAQGNPYANSSKPLDPSFVNRSSINIETPDAISYKEGQTLANIQGSLFYKNEFEKAIIYTTSGNPVFMDSCRINLYSNAVYYKYIFKEYVAGANMIKKIIIGNDSATTKTFINIIDLAKNVDQFYEQVSEGKIQLLKKRIKTLVHKDSLFNTIKVPVISTKEIPFIYTNGTLYPVYHSYKKVIETLGLITDGNKEWLKKEGNKLKNEKNILLFFAFLNKN